MASSVIDTLIAEAGSDPEGLRAVAWVIQNRATQWGMTPEQVVKQKGQFEGYYNPGPKSREAQKSAKVRAKAEAAWQAVTSGSVPDPTNGGTSFRAKGTKQPAPNGTVEIGGNVFALGSGVSNSALSAINAVAPTPMPSRPVALGYAKRAAIPAPKGSYTLDPPAMPLNVPLPPRASSWQEASGPPMRGDIPLPRSRPTPPAPARGVGTSYLAPATKVKTVPIDPVTGNPILAQATPSPRSPVGYGPSWDNLQGMTVGAWDDAAPWNNVGPRPKPFVGGVVPSQSKQTPQQIANERVIAGIPVIGSLAVGLGTAADLVQRIAPPQASATPQPQPTKLPSVIPEKAGPPAPPRSVPKSDTSIGTFVTQFGSNTGKPAPLPPKPPKSSDRLVAGDVQKDAFVQTYYPDMYSPEAVKRGQDIASALYPKPAATSATKAISAATLPRLPMMPTAGMSAARLPTVPVRTAPIAPARIPLPRTRTVNPMTQIVPAVQARAGQGLLGGLLNMLTAGNVPQANTQQRQPQQYPTPIPGQTGVEINGVDLAFMPKSVQQSTRWRTGY